MPFSMYQATVPTLLQSLKALDIILGKAEANAAERKIDPTVLLNYRLAPDMFAFTRQVQLVTDFAKGTMARLAGQEVPKYEDTESSIAELKARVAKVTAYVQSFKPADLDGSETRDITIPVNGQPTVFKGADYLTNVALPNFFFHATTAYAILRHCGVGIGKRDFLART
jgi:uncharacterized protein